MSSTGRTRTVLTLSFCLLCAASAVAGDEDAEGYWQGAIELPGSSLEVQLRLAPGADGWSGTISIPAQGARDLALTGITVEGTAVSFAIADIPGDPTFAGTLDGDGIAGAFSQGGQVFPFTLARGDEPATEAARALEGIDGVIEQALDDFGAAGLGLGVVVDGEVVLAKGYGLRDVGGELPVTADTLFAIGSASKAFTTFVLGTLVDEGVLDWDEPLRSYLPDFRLLDEHATSSLTVRDLVSHRSGLPRHDLSWYNADASRRELYERLRHLEPFRDLRERFHYQNLMFLVAGYLIEELTGECWEANVHRRIFDPLGMDSSNFSVEDSQQATDFALPYNHRKGETEQVPFRNIDTMGPAGSINSSVKDMSRWLQVQLGGGSIDGEQLIQEATLRDMHTPHMTMSRYPEPGDVSILQSYGLGWFIESFRGRYMVQHGGGIDGFITLVAFLPAEGIGVVTLSNTSGLALSPVLNRMVVDRLLGHSDKDWLGEALTEMKEAEAVADRAEADKDLVRVDGTSPSHPLADYAGEYRHPGYGVLAVELAEGVLALSFNRMSSPLEHWHYDVFQTPEDDAPGLGGIRFQFRSDVDGHISEVVAPFEPEAGDVVFSRMADRRLSDPAYLERFVGRYELAGQVITVSLRGNRLVAEAPGQPALTLNPMRETTFELEGLAGFSATFVDENGEVIAMRLNQPNGVFTATRMEEQSK